MAESCDVDFRLEFPRAQLRVDQCGGNRRLGRQTLGESLSVPLFLAGLRGG